MIFWIFVNYFLFIQRLAEWFTSFLIPDFFFFFRTICLCLKSVISDLTDFALSQVEPIYLPGPTDWDGEGDRLTPGTCSNQLQMCTEVQQTNTSKYKYKAQNLTNFPPQIPDTGVGKGVPHEPLPHKAPPDRDGSPTLPHREADQNLVPEQVRLFFVFVFLFVFVFVFARILQN